MTARRVARELAVIMMPQLPKDKKKLEKLEFDSLLCRSVQILTEHARQCLSEAGGYLANARQEIDEIEINHPDNSHKIADVKPVKLTSDELKRQLEILDISLHLIEEALDIPDMVLASDHVPENVTCTNCGNKQKLALKRPGSAAAKGFLEYLLEAYLDHREEIDEIIGAIKSKWRIERMVSIDRDILRLACAEAFYLNDIPVRVAISEAVELAHRFADDRAAKFINGVLADLSFVAERFRSTGELDFEPHSDEESGHSKRKIPRQEGKSIHGRGQRKSGWWGTALGKLKTALHRTKSTLVDPIVDGTEDESDSANRSGSGRTAATLPARAVDEDYLSEVEEKLIRADVGIATAETLVDHMRREAHAKMWNSHDVEAFLKREFNSMLSASANNKLNVAPEQLAIILIVGVNGTGKTTSIGKLCWRLKQDGKRVLIAAGDTFRAAAETQLEIWAERAGVDIVRLPDGSDPGAVVYKAIERARTEKFDVLIIDTAGRLHNKANLMAELKKIRGVIDKNATGCSLESLLVVDASVGQTGLQQAKIFAESCPLTGVILSKLDGSAKGGIVFSIAKDLNLPIKLVGLGEKIDDLRDFEPPVFVEALFSK